MGALNRFLERLGFVRLRDYGLILTPARRVVSLRSIALDDGFGQRVVGWLDGDLPTMELDKWGGAPAPRPTAAAVPPRPTAAAVPPIRPAAPVAPPPQPKQPTKQPIEVVPPPEEEWDWEIAAARARAEELDDEHDWDIAAARARAEAADDETDWESAVARARAAAVDSPRVVAAPPVAATRPIPPAAPANTGEPPAPVARPSTIIAVPALPVAVDPQVLRHYDAAARKRLPAPRRFPQGTRPVRGS